MKLLCLLAAALAVTAAPASATLYFDFSYDGAGIGLTSGQLLTEDTAIDAGFGQMAYRVVGITGRRGGAAGDVITGLLPAGVAFDDYGDVASNLLYVSGLTPDYYGITYTFENEFGTFFANLFSTEGGVQEFLSDGHNGSTRSLDYFTVTPGEAPVAPVPEPGMLGLMAGGIGLIALSRRRRGCTR